MGLIVPALDCVGEEIRKGDVIRNIFSGEKTVVTGRYWSKKHKQARIEFRPLLGGVLRGTTATHEWQVLGQIYEEENS